MVNQLLGVNNVTVTLQWPREPGAIYHISVSPETLLMKSHAIILSHDTITVNLTISYNVRYDVTIVSSLCNVTATKILTYSKCIKYVMIACTLLFKMVIDKLYATLKHSW